MRVLHIITGLGDGGAEAVLHRLITHDAQDEHQVISLTGEGKYGALLRGQGIPVTALGLPRGRLTLRGVRTLWRAVRQARADVMQTWMYHADLVGGSVGRLVGLPVVWGVRNTTLDPQHSSRSTRWVARACGLTSRMLPRRIVVCAQAAVAVHRALGYDDRRMVVIPNGYDLGRFRPDPAARLALRQAWQAPDGVPLVGMVARWDAQKDHANLLAALRLLVQSGQPFQAVLVGHGMQASNSALASLVAQAGLEDRMLLLGPRTDIPAVMNALDVHVLSSAYGEAFPNVLAEAMACGTPCVTTDVGDAAAIVGDTGWVAPPRDAAALSDALQTALRAWEERPAWAQRQAAARQRIEQHYTIETMVQRYRQVWREVQSCAA